MKGVVGHTSEWYFQHILEHQKEMLESIFIVKKSHDRRIENDIPGLRDLQESAKSASSKQSSDASTRSKFSLSTNPTSYASENQHIIEVPPFVLPCEFITLETCEVIFELDRTDAWIDHIITRHLRNRLPARAICWFCDTWTYDDTGINFHNNRRLAFKYRMEHIRSHINAGKTVNDIRPDFHMLDHLYNHKLISEVDFNRYRKRYHDLPFPREQMRGIYRPGFVPPEKYREQELENRIEIDLAKEDRDRRRSDKSQRKVPDTVTKYQSKDLNTIPRYTP